MLLDDPDVPRARVVRVAAIVAVLVVVAAAAAVLTWGGDDDQGGELASEGPARPLRVQATYLPPGYQLAEAGDILDSYASTDWTGPSGEAALYGTSALNPPILAVVSLPAEVTPPEGVVALLSSGVAVTDAGSGLPEIPEQQDVKAGDAAGVMAAGIDGQIAVGWQQGDRSLAVIGLGMEESDLLGTAERVEVGSEGPRLGGGAGDRSADTSGAGEVAEDRFDLLAAGTFEEAFAATGSSVDLPGAQGLAYLDDPAASPLVVSMAPGGPLSLGFVRLMAPSSESVEVRGEPALVTRNAPDEHGIVWIEGGTLLKVTFNDLSLEEGLSVADGLRSVDEARWAELVAGPPPTWTGSGVATGAEGVVLDGTPDGELWRVHASYLPGRGPKGLSLVLVGGPDDQPGFVELDEPLTVYYAPVADGDHILYGAAGAEVAAVTITTGTGEETTLTPSQPDDATGTFPLDFFALDMGAGAGSGSVRATDAAGTVLAEATYGAPSG